MTSVATWFWRFAGAVPKQEKWTNNSAAVAKVCELLPSCCAYTLISPRSEHKFCCMLKVRIYQLSVYLLAVLN